VGFNKLDVVDLDANELDIGKNNFGSSSSTPHADEQRDSDKRTMGVQLTISSPTISTLVEKKFGSRTSTPHAPMRSGTPAKGRWGGVNDHLDVNDLDISCKNFGARTSTPGQGLLVAP
jgi:hypothetical protein